MRASNEGLQAIVDSEGIVLNPYDDGAGFLTIGVGHKLTVEETFSGVVFIDGGPVPWKDGFSWDQAIALLEQDAGRAEAVVNELVEVELTQGQFDALVSFVFNVGQGNFKRSTLLRVLNEGDYEEVPNQLNRWVYAGRPKKVMRGLVVRRTREIRLWNS